MLALLLAGLGLGLYQAQEPSSSNQQPSQDPLTVSAAAPQPVAAASPASAAALPVAPASRAASDASNGAWVRPSHWASAEQVAQLEAQWCNHAAQAHRQALSATDQARPKWDDIAGMSAWAEARAKLPGSQAAFEVRARVAQTWIAALRAQGSPRSQAIANQLVLARTLSSEQERAQAYALTRTQVLKLRDPLFVELWTGMEPLCERVLGQCPPIALQRWPEIEPQNLMAWLPFQYEATTISETQWRGIASASYARAYRGEMVAQLLPLLEQTKSKLEYEEGIGLIEFLENSWTWDSSLFLLARVCERLPGDSPHRGACLHAAELLWNNQHASILDHTTALALSRGVAGQQEDVWVERQRQMNAMSREDHQILMETHHGRHFQKAGCEFHLTRHQRLQAIAEGGSLKAGQLAVAQRRNGGAP